jgi:pre-rRNA-processing protein TSR2
MEHLDFGVRQILRNWHPLKTAVEQGWGGQDSIEKAVWFESVCIEELVRCEYADEIADYIEEILANEFHMSFEGDNSIDIVRV